MKSIYSRASQQKRYSLIYTRIEHLRANEKHEIVDTNKEENFVASSIERPVAIAVELRLPLVRIALVLHIEVQNSVLKMREIHTFWEIIELAWQSIL